MSSSTTTTTTTSSSSFLTLETLPADVIRGIADHLNPAESCRLSTCTTRLRLSLPPPLCLRIVKKSSSSSPPRGQQNPNQQQQQHRGQDEDEDEDVTGGGGSSSFFLAQQFFVSKAAPTITPPPSSGMKEVRNESSSTSMSSTAVAGSSHTTTATSGNTPSSSSCQCPPPSPTLIPPPPPLPLHHQEKLVKKENNQYYNPSSSSSTSTSPSTSPFSPTSSISHYYQFRPLSCTDQLEYDIEYWFWSFDYQLNQRIFLGRQVRITDFEDTIVQQVPIVAADVGGADGAAAVPPPPPPPPPAPGIVNGNDNNNNNNNDTTTTTTQVTKYRYGYHVGMSPRYPNQTWQIHKLMNNNNNNNNNNDNRSQVVTSSSSSSSSLPSSDRIVPWNTTIRLSVGGTHPKLEQPDSYQRQWLSAPPMSQVITRGTGTSAGNNNNNEHHPESATLLFWHVTHDKEEEEVIEHRNATTSSTTTTTSSHNDEIQLQLVPVHDYEVYQQRRQQRYGVRVSNATTLRLSSPPSSTPTQTIDYGYHLTTYPTPEVCDKGLYLLYSPEQLLQQQQQQPHNIDGFGIRSSSSNPTSTITNNNNNYNNNNEDPTSYPGAHAHVSFWFFTHNGMVYLRALNLSFWLGIPILMEDSNSIVGYEQSSPLLGLFHKRSSRWGCIKYYFATSADVQEGTPLNLQDFLTRVTDHDDHSVLQKQISIPRRRRQGRPSQTSNSFVTNLVTTTTTAIQVGEGDDDNEHATQEQVEEEEDLVYIYVKDAILDKSTPNFPLDDSQIWRFVLC